jgi:hypothetical protein
MSTTPAYPVRLDGRSDQPLSRWLCGELSRGLVLVKWWLLAGYYPREIFDLVPPFRLDMGSEDPGARVPAHSDDPRTANYERPVRPSPAVGGRARA